MPLFSPGLNNGSISRDKLKSVAKQVVVVMVFGLHVEENEDLSLKVNGVFEQLEKTPELGRPDLRSSCSKSNTVQLNH